MKIGYARVSTAEQNLDLQIAAFQAAGVDEYVGETISGAKFDRPELSRLLKYRLRAGDTLVVWRLDRLGRSLADLIALIRDLDAKGVGFQSVTESIDTTTPGGKLVFHIFGALAEFERDLIRERTKAGLVAARARGRKGGRRRWIDNADPQKLANARVMAQNPAVPVGAICDYLGCSRDTYYKYIGPKQPLRP